MKKYLIIIVLNCIVTLSYAQYSSDICNGGTATSSSNWPGYIAALAFDNDMGDLNAWATATGNTTGWIMYELPEARNVTAYSLTARKHNNSGTTGSPQDWILEGSNDNNSWTLLDSRTNETGWDWSIPETRFYAISNTDSYKFYKITIQSNNGNTDYSCIGEIEMFTDAVFLGNGNPGSQWYFGFNASIDFRYDPPIIGNESAMSQWEGCASISDSSGSLLFYTNGITIYDSTHNVMLNGTGLNGHQQSTQSGVIVPHPTDANLFYVFTVTWNGAPDGIQYSVVDMSLNGGLGAVTAEKNIQLNTPNSEKITAVQHADEESVWVISHSFRPSTDVTAPDDEFYAYLIDDSGINTTPVVSAVGYPHALGANDWNGAGYMKVSPDGSRIAVNVLADGITQVLDFDNSTGVVSNPLTLTPSTDLHSRAYGLEFSPDGTKLYTAAWTYHDIWQYDLTAGSETDIQNSKVVVGTSFNELGALQVAPDGRIYVCRNVSHLSSVTNPEWLGVINHQNMPGLSCDFVDDGLFIGPGQSGIGLPTFIQSYFATGFSSANHGYSDTSVFFMTNSSVDSVLWIFNDPQVAPEDTSTAIQPEFVFGSPGTYTVEMIYWRMGLADTIMQDVTILSMPSIIALPDTTICSGESLVLNPGVEDCTYAWSTGETTQSISVNASGNYTVGVMDSNNCIAYDTALIDTHSIIPAELGDDIDTCAQDSVVLSLMDFENYVWSDGETDSVLTVYTSDEYIVTVSDAYGCTDSDTIQVVIHNPPEIDLGETIDTCTSDLIGVEAPDGYADYVWSTGATEQSIDVNTSGVYLVTILDANGCAAQDSIEVNISIPVEIDLPEDTIICEGDSILLHLPEGMDSYLWSDGSTAVSLWVGDSEIYYATVTSGSCTASDSTGLQISSPYVDLPPDQTICYNDSLLLEAETGFLAYEWTNGETTESLIVYEAGNYSVTVTDSIACVAADSIHIEVGEPIITNLEDTLGFCAGNQLVLYAGDDFSSYTWSNGAFTQAINVADAGWYFVTVVNDQGCSTLDSSYAQMYELPNIDLPQDTSSCVPVELLVENAGADFIWSNGETTAGIICMDSGSYEVTVIDSNGCSENAIVNVSIGGYFNMNVNADTIICNEESVSLSAPAGYVSYLWSNGSTQESITTDLPGGYSVSVTNDEGCVGIDSFYLQKVVVAIDIPDNTGFCKGESVVLSGTEMGAYEWSTGDVGSTIEIDQAGIYYVTLTYQGCSDISDIDVVEYAQPNVVAGILSGHTDTIINGGSTFLDVVGAQDYTWQDDQSLSCTDCMNPEAEPLETTIYYVTGTDAHGCADTASVEVFVDYDHHIFLPTAFSPNDDGQNDVLYVYGEGIKKLHLGIYNRWGELVFETASQENGWDGTYKGKRLDPAVFVYILRVTYYDGKSLEKSGNITLVR